MLRRRGALVLYTLLIVCFCVVYISYEGMKSNLEGFNTIPDGIQVLPSITSATTNNSTTTCSQGTLMFGNYCVISPYDNEMKAASSVGLVTLCTQGTVEFLDHIIALCNRWSAPISVAVYSPKVDYKDARVLVDLLRQCDLCVRYWVNWHFFFIKQKMPDVIKFQQNGNCSSVTLPKIKKRRSQDTYPINVGRNVARKLASTPFIFSSDIELYPSLNIPIKFERMLRSQTTSNNSTNQVWVIPVFEVSSKFRAPFIKPSLRDMFNKHQVISFHQYRCNVCHRIPNLTQWINHEGNKTNSELQDFLEPLKIWTTVKRSRLFKLQFWEPFFIGTNNDPEFDIRLTWEGKQNKMQVAFEMCMRNYSFHILENAFLVHSPGINVYSLAKDKARANYTSENGKVINMIRRDLRKKYGSRNNC